MSLSKLEATLILCIEYHKKNENEEKVIELKERLKTVRSKSLSSGSDDIGAYIS